MSKKLLVVVDYQNDFVDGALGFEKATKIAPYIISLVKKYEEEEGEDEEEGVQGGLRRAGAEARGAAADRQGEGGSRHPAR